MQIILYSGFSKEANSTKQPTSGGSAVDVRLKENVSVVHPVFILDTTDTSINYVQWGNRYYFVDDIIFIRNTTIELHCTVDVLATYKTQIGAPTQYVTRSASAKSGRVIDSLYPIMAGSTTAQTSLTDINSLYYDKDGTYIVGVVSKNSAGDSGITYYSFTPSAPAGSTFQDFIAYLFGGSWLNAPTTEISTELQKELVNPFQYIVSAMWFPFNVSGTSLQGIKFGYWDAVGVSAYVLTQKNYISSCPFTLPTHPMQNYGEFLNGAPYTTHMLRCFSLGDIPIDPDYFITTHNGYVTLNTDLVTGVAELDVFDSSQRMIDRSFGQIGVPVQISQINQQLIQTAISTLDIASNVASGVGSAMTGNVAGAVSSGLGVISNIGNAIQSAMPQVRTQGANGTRVAFRNPASIITTFRNIAPTDYQHNGYPLMERRQIQSLSGFIQVENPDVDIVGTVYEKDMIINYMSSGFYYE